MIVLVGNFLNDHDFDANRANLASINKKTGSMFLSQNQKDNFKTQGRDQPFFFSMGGQF